MNKVLLVLRRYPLFRVSCTLTIVHELGKRHVEDYDISAMHTLTLLVAGWPHMYMCYEEVMKNA